MSDKGKKELIKLLNRVETMNSEEYNKLYELAKNKKDLDFEIIKLVDGNFWEILSE